MAVKDTVQERWDGLGKLLPVMCWAKGLALNSGRRKEARKVRGSRTGGGMDLDGV